MRRRIFITKSERVDTTQLELELKDKIAALDRLAGTLRIGPAATPPNGGSGGSRPKLTGLVVGPSDPAERERRRRDIAGAVSTAAEASGGEVVPPGYLVAAGLASCTSADCYGKIATVTGAVYVLVVDAHFERDSFKLRIDIWSGGGEHVDGEGRDCDGCTTTDMLKALRDQTTVLCERVFPNAPAGGGRHARPELGIGLIVAGAIAAGSGVVLWTMNNGGVDCTDIPGEGSRCLRQRHTVPASVSLLGVGLAGIGTGIYFVTGPRTREVALSLTVAPSALVLGGAF